jgi:hypothetical protein
MRTSLACVAALVAAMTLVSRSATAMVAPDCVPDGGSSTQTFDRPPIDAPGMPTNAHWSGGDGEPQASDVDTWSGPDAMGPGTSSASGDTASVTVHNSGGNIIGPNGAVVEGGLEGSCVEMVMVWTFRYSVTTSVCVNARLTVSTEVSHAVVSGEVGRQHCVQVEIWLEGIVTDGPQVVCPC